MHICAVAHALPSCRVTNEDLLERFAARMRGTATGGQHAYLSDFLKQQLEQTGAVERYHRADGESALEFGVSAGQQALERAGVTAGAIDLLIYVGVGRGFVEPATANVFQSALKLSNATCFDILDACASWLRALDVARSMLLTGRYRLAMILNCEFNFREYEPSRVESKEELDDLWAGYTVGEAATATILGRSDSDRSYHVTFRNSGQHAPLCQIPLPQAGQFLNGASRPDRVALRFYTQPNSLAARAIRQLHEQYWGDQRFASFDYDIIFGHSASVPVSRRVADKLDLDIARYYELFPRYGNTVSAALPLGMSLAQDEAAVSWGPCTDDRWRCGTLHRAGHARLLTVTH